MVRVLLRLSLFLVFIAAPLVLAVFFAYQAAPPKLSLKPAEFSGLKGWQDAGHRAAFSAFLKSCEKLTPRPGYLTPERFRTEAYARAFGDACAKALEGESFYSQTDNAARGFFEAAFTPYRMRVGRKNKGKITGYYEPLIEASLEPGPGYPWPLYAAPGDQIRIDLSKFSTDLSGTLIGRLKGNALLPYYTRREINEGALEGKGLEILYAKDPIDVYFLQIQGSGRARLPDGAIIGVGYAGKNGHINRLAGRTLVQMGEMEVGEVSMPSIRKWFEDNPDRTFEVLHEDDSYVFFHVTGDDGPFGSSGAVLTPEHSLAVDPGFIPMGAPIFIDGEVPALSDPENTTEALRRLMIAQDTGGAIRGEIRGDVFWGRGETAEIISGYMNNEARFTLLLPKGAMSEDRDD